MCKFLSAIYTTTGKLICEPVYTDSHSDLAKFAGIRERETTAPVQQFVRLELLPPADTDRWTDLASWSEHIDDHEVPEWFDSAARYDAFSAMRDIIAQSFCDGSDRLMLGRLLICTAGSVEVRGCRVMALGSSTVTALGSSAVTARDSSTVSARDSSTVSAFNSSTVTAFDSSTVTAFDSSTVTAFDSSTVAARDSSTVTARDSSTVTAFDSSTVTARDFSTVTAFDSSTVTARDFSTVTARDSSTVTDTRKRKG